jgi:uncharacterized Tic20 family protein
MEISERGWRVLCHSSAFLGVLPGGHILGPLMVWLFKRDASESLYEQGLESLNFQISMTVLFVFVYFLKIIWIGKPLMIMLTIVDIYMVINASVKVYNGVRYKYPLNFRLIR